MSAKKLKQIRKMSGRSAEVFAEKLGVSRDTLKSYESGRMPILKKRMTRAKEILKAMEGI